MKKTQLMFVPCLVLSLISLLLYRQVSELTFQLELLTEELDISKQKLAKLEAASAKQSEQTQIEKSLLEKNSTQKVAEDDPELVAASSKAESQQHSSVSDSSSSSVSDNDFKLRARMSAIEKFVTITAEQKSRLEEKFRNELQGKEAASLDEIIGEENADYYRKQMKDAFARAEKDTREREVAFLAKKLQLLPEQEAQLDNIFSDVEARVKTELNGLPSNTVEQRIKKMLEENKIRSQLLNEELKKIFTSAQYELFLQQNQEQDFQVWHESE